MPAYFQAYPSVVVPNALVNHVRSAAPILGALEEYTRQQTVRFHMPGHKGGRGADPLITGLLGRKVFAHDVTNVPGMDDLHQATEAICLAQDLAAATFGAEATYFLINGASCGLQALVMAVCNPGDKVLVPRNLHRSLLGGLILSGASPVFFAPTYDPDLGIPLAVSPQTIANALARHPDARAAFVVNPTYHGIASDLAAIADIVHAYNIPLLVDEAHGAHLRFHEALPPCALGQGADACVQGTHKNLAAFTQAAMLHIRGGRINRVRLEAILRLLQSTSTSYLLLASLDAARLQMANCGHQLLQQALELAEGLRHSVNEIAGLFSFDEEWVRQRGAVGLDRLKVTITVKDAGISGLWAEEWLRQHYHIQMEMSDPLNLLAIVTFGNTAADVQRLLRGLRDMVGSAERPAPKDGLSPRLASPPLLPPDPVLAFTPREAFLAPAETLPLAKAVGRISTEVITCYPPGIPILCPGEVITREVLDYIKLACNLGVRLQGPADPTVNTVRVVK